MKNLLLWFHFDENGEITKLSRIQIPPPSADLEQIFLIDYFKPPFAGGGIEKIEKEHVTIPDRLMGVDGVAFVLYAGGRKFAAVLPYFVMIEE